MHLCNRSAMTPRSPPRRRGRGLSVRRATCSHSLCWLCGWYSDPAAGPAGPGFKSLVWFTVLFCCFFWSGRNGPALAEIGMARLWPGYGLVDRRLHGLAASPGMHPSSAATLASHPLRPSGHSHARRACTIACTRAHSPVRAAGAPPLAPPTTLGTLPLHSAPQHCAR